MLGSFSFAQLNTEPVILVPGLESIPLAGHISVLRDEKGAWTIADIQSPGLADQFSTSDETRFSYGYTQSAYWYRIALRNPEYTQIWNMAWVVEALHPLLDYLDVYIVRSNGTVERHLTGDHRPAPAEQLPSRVFALPLTAAPGEQVSLYIRAMSAGPLILEISVKSNAAFQDQRATDNLWYGAFFGIMLVMILYNLIIYLWIRDRAYGYYVLTLVIITYGTLIQSGYARLYGDALFEGGSIWLCSQQPFAVALSLFFGALFVREFAGVGLQFPRVDRLIGALAVVWGALTLAMLFLGYRVASPITVIGQGVTTIFFLSLVIYLSLKGVRSARFLLLAWGCSCVAIGALILASLAMLPFGFLVYYGWQISIVVAVTTLSLALADRVATERHDRERFARLRQYLPQKVADLVVEGSGEALLDAKRRKVTVCVIDLRGFTPFSEISAPEDVMSVLREFFETMGDIVEKHGGTVEHFAGDSMLIFFNAPLEIQEPEKQAVQTAFEMREAFAVLREKWARHGHELGLGIGIADGYATIGAIGFSGRSQYAAIGAVTNLASRLCSDSKHGEILITRRVLAEVESFVISESIGARTIRGFAQPIEVIRIKGIQSAL